MKVPGVGRGEELFSGDRASGRDGNSDGDDGGDGRTTGMYLTPLNCASKIVKMVNFMVYILLR